MNQELAIVVEKLGKKFKIKSVKNGRTMHHKLEQIFRKPLKKLVQSIKNGSSFGNKPHLESSSFWALKEISFKIQHGEVVGIIGHNGAGKSVLLKILSQITKPSEGTAEIHGRCGSMLEVDSGFHPELTGRENIFMSGAILGMKKEEIRNKFDAIVKLSEMEKFLDTPVKRYSSGMRVRLAFSIAAHLEPEILIMDEILAVGDKSFRKKCITHLKKLTQEGQTVLIVSHNMKTIEALCSRVLWFDHGLLRLDASPQIVLKEYALEQNNIENQ